jgi:formylglycine-generating enzyme required for sulfatase activity
MRVWIPSEKRYGDSGEKCWAVETAHDPRPDGPADEMWDRVDYRLRQYKTRGAAERAAKRSKSNAAGVAQVYEMKLEQLHGVVWDWVQDGDRIEIDCIFEK